MSHNAYIKHLIYQYLLEDNHKQSQIYLPYILSNLLYCMWNTL